MSVFVLIYVCEMSVVEIRFRVIEANIHIKVIEVQQLHDPAVFSSFLLNNENNVNPHPQILESQQCLASPSSPWTG